MVKETAKQVEDITVEAKKTLDQNVEKVTRGMEEAAQFGQDNVEAMVASSKIAAKAAETVSAEILAFTKKSYEDGLAAAKDLTASKSVTEFFEKQTAYSKTATEDFIAEATKLNEIASAAFKEASQPLSARVNAAVEMVKSVRA